MSRAHSTANKFDKTRKKGTAYMRSVVENMIITEIILPTGVVERANDNKKTNDNVIIYNASEIYTAHTVKLASTQLYARRVRELRRNGAREARAPSVTFLRNLFATNSPV